MTPSVSVIVPNYNHARFLDRRLMSITQQSFNDFDVTILDDCSIDESRSIIERFAQGTSIRTLYNASNSGNPFKQWNKGIRASQGKYIWIAESDDFCDDDLLNVLVQTLDSDSSVGVAYCQSWRVNEQGVIIGSMLDWTDELSPTRWSIDFVNQGSDECKNFLCWKNTIPNASAVLFRREVYERIGGVDENFRLCGDWMFWVQALLVSDIAFIAEPHNFFRQHHRTVRQDPRRNGSLTVEALRIAACIQEKHRIPEHVMTNVIDYRLATWKSAVEAMSSSQIRLLNREAWRWIQRIDRDLSPRILGDIYVTAAFACHARNDRVGVLRNSATALRYNPSWIRSRGVWSIVREALLP